MTSVAASVTEDLGSRCRTYSITAPTLISLEHCRFKLELLVVGSDH